MKKKNLALNKSLVSSLNNREAIKGGVVSQATNCLSPATCLPPPPPPPPSYTHCVPNQSACIKPGHQ